MPRIVDVNEVTTFLGFPPDELRNLVREKGEAGALPEDSGDKSFLAREMVRRTLKGKGAYVFWDEWGVWPNSEIPHMHARIRASEGIHTLLIDSRCEFVSEEDREYLECIVACGLYFVWGFVVIGIDDKLAIWADHDEWMGVWSPENSVLEEAVRWLNGPEGAEPTERQQGVLPKDFVCCDGMRELDLAGLVEYLPWYRVIAIKRDAGQFPINVCPICSKRVPKQLVERWEKEVGKAVGSNGGPDDVPEEFSTDEWWRKRGL